MGNISNLWAFYFEVQGRQIIVAVKRCKRPQSTKVFKTLPDIAHQNSSSVYGYSLIEYPEGTEFFSKVLGEIRYFKFALTAWGNKLYMYQNGEWEFCDYNLPEYHFV